MSKTAKVTAEFDVNTGKFETGVQRAVNAVKKYKTEIDLAAHSTQILGGVLSAASWGYDKFQALSGSIIKINSDFETLKTSLTGLISASHSNVNSLGRLMGVQEKWALSTKKADDTLQSLNKIASKTSFNLDQTAQMFKSFYSTANSNMSLKQSIEAFEGLANMASVVGINVDQMIRTLDGVGSGKWTSSELTRFLEGSLGLTKEAAQEAIKAGKYYDLLMEKTAEFAKMADATGNTFEAVTEAFKSEVENLTRSLTGEMFNSFKDGIKEATTFLKENKDAIVGAANTAVELAKHLGALGAAYYGARIANNLYDKAVKAMTASALLSNQALSAKTKALGLLSISIDKAKTATLALKAAFKSFLPTAGILLATEAIMSFSASLTTAEKNAEKLKKTLALTNDEIAKLTKNQLRDKEIELSAALYAKNEEMRQLGFKLRRDGKSLSSSSELDALKSEYKGIKEYLEKIEQAKKGLLAPNESVSRTAELVRGKTDELNDALDKASEKAKNVTTLGRLKTELAEIDGLIKNLQKPLNNPEKEKQRLDTLEALRVMREKTAKQIAEFNKQDIKNLGDINSSYREIARVGMSEYEKKLDDINQKYKKWLEDGVNKDIAKKARASLISALDKEEADKAIKEHSKFLKEKEELEKKYFETIGEYEKAWEIESKKYKEEIKKLGLTEEDAKKYLEIQKKKYLEPYVKHSKAAFKDIKNSWADTVSSMQKTVDDGFFNYFIGKTKSLKTALKDIDTNLMRDLISPYARVLSQGISGGFGALLGGGSNLASIASNLGLAKNDSGGWSGLVGGTTVELSSTGEILRGASALDKSTTSLLSSVSNLQSAYSLLTSGYTGFISSFTSTPALNAASWLSMHGYAGLGQGVYGFGTGVKGALTATQFSGAGTAPYMAGSAFGGAALGYGIGYLGDKLFKANTYASTGGALGGAAGGLIAGMKAGSSMGPWGAVIGAVAGALIGGAFGKKKATGSGISVLQDITAGDALSNQNIRSYVDMQKKGWFSKKSWTEMSDLDDTSMREIGAQLRSMGRMASRAGALASLTLKTGKYSGESLANEGFAKAILRSMTGQAEQMWAEVTESGGKKRKGLLGKIGGVFEKAMKFSPSSIINRITKPLDDAISKTMNKAGLGAIDNMARGMRDEFGKASDGNIFGLKSSRKIDDLLNLSKDETNKNQRLVDNPEFPRMWKDWEEQAKKANKKVIELMSESLGAIADSYKSLELLTVRNPIKQVEISMRQAFESFTDAAEALKLDIPKQMGSIADLSVERMARAYRKAIAADFTKSNVDSLNSLVKAYEAAKKAQDEYTKAVVNFTQSIANTQGGFYQALGFDTNFLSLQNVYTRLRNIAGALESDLDDKEKSDVAKIGNSNDPRVWAKYFHDMGSAKLQEFLATGNVEMRAELVKLAAEYRTFTAANGGRDVWLKSFNDIEAIAKQIAALKLAEAAQNTLNLQREQLNLLNKQKSILEKIAQTAQKLRDSVIDSSTSELNYRFALERARIAYNAKDYDSTAYENLNTAVAKQEQYLKQTAGSYAEYKLSILKMASEIEGITGAASLDDINRQIKRLEGLLNSNSNSQLSALEAQKEALIKGANDQINAMELLLGSDSPIVRYLKEALGSLKEGKAPGEYKGGISNISNGGTTANGATINSQLDRDINAIYKDVLGRSVEQGGLDAWKRKAQLEGLSKEQLRAQIEATARAATGGSTKADFIEWSKRQGLKPYAEGGIVTRPTRALIGEAGAEAVIPLKNGAVRAQIVGGDNSELVSLMREGVYLMKEINKNTREGTMVLKDVTNGTEFLVKAV